MPAFSARQAQPAFLAHCYLGDCKCATAETWSRVWACRGAVLRPMGGTGTQRSSAQTQGRHGHAEEQRPDPREALACTGAVPRPMEGMGPAAGQLGPPLCTVASGESGCTNPKAGVQQGNKRSRQGAAINPAGLAARWPARPSTQQQDTHAAQDVPYARRQHTPQ